MLNLTKLFCIHDFQISEVNTRDKMKTYKCSKCPKTKQITL